MRQYSTMRPCSTFLLAVLATSILATLNPSESFSPTITRPIASTSPSTARRSRSSLYADRESATTETSTAQDDNDNNNPLGLTPELLKLTNAFESIGDDKLRYKQLLYMANQLKPMDAAQKTPENQVPGCLSTVHVHATLQQPANNGNDDDDDPVVQYSGDSDGLLTKGLVALLVRGLSENTPQAIQRVDPSFIQKAGIAASLTPGRNNGFLNMLAVMKKKALELQQEEAATTEKQKGSIDDSSKVSSATTTTTTTTGRPKYDAMIAALEKLQPVQLELTDKSHEHAGHVEAGNGNDGESHFDLVIVSKAFDGLNLVQRHQLVYMILAEIMPQIHALQIRAQTPDEAGM